MNKIMFTLIQLSVLFFSCTHKKGPSIAYDKKIINLGVLQFESAYAGKIVVRNNGDESLKILRTSPDCSCTVTRVEKAVIEPQDSTFIHFQITPARDGYIQQNIYLENNSVNESRVLFLIRANVKMGK